MIRIRKSQVPAYLQEGEFYLSLSDEGDEAVEVPVDTVKPDTTVKTPADLRHLLSSLRFWIVNQLPRSMMDYVLTHDLHETETVMLEFSEQNDRLGTLWTIKTAVESERMELAIKSGIHEIVEYLFHIVESNDYCPIAAKYGQLDCLKYFHEQGSVWDHRTTQVTAIFGQLDCLQYAVHNGCAVTGTTEEDQFPHNFLICTLAVTNAAGQQQYRNRDKKAVDSFWREGLSEVTAASKLSCLKYLRAQQAEWDWTTLRNAAASGHLETVRYLHEHACPTNNGEDVCTAAALFGHLDCLRYLHEQGYNWNLNTTHAAIESGHLHCLQYLFDNGCPLHGDVCAFAATHGQLDCLKYLHALGCPWDSYLCARAVECGHLSCLQYAHENGCEWDEDVVRSAAFIGNLDCLRYALENGCPYAANMVAWAAFGGHVECLRYLIEHGYPCDVASLLDNMVARNKGTIGCTSMWEAVISYLRQFSASASLTTQTW